MAFQDQNIDLNLNQKKFANSLLILINLTVIQQNNDIFLKLYFLKFTI